MKLFSTRFCAAIAFSSASASASPSGAGSRIGAARAIDAGTTCSISARRDGAPIADSMLRLVVGVDADVAGDELGAGLELGERLQGGHQHRVFSCGEIRGSAQAFLTSSS